MESNNSRSRGPKPFEFPSSPAGSPAMCSADDVISGGKLLPFCPPRSPPSKIGKTIQSADSLAVGKAGYRRLRKEADPDPIRRSKARWYVLAFRPVKVPAGMEMKEIRIRQRRKLVSIDEEERKKGWGPWKLLRSLSCKGVEFAGDCHRRIIL